MTDLSDAIFHDEIKASEHLEHIRWPNGPFCPHCGEAEQVHRLEGEAHLHRYLVEWDFKFNDRKTSDDVRAVKALKGIEDRTATPS